MSIEKSETKRKPGRPAKIEPEAVVISAETAVMVPPVAELPRMTSTLDLMALAVQSKSGVDQLERLMAMKNAEEERSARRDFFEALSKFQELVGPIMKDKTVDFPTARGVTNYRHASLGQIESQIKGPMREVGLSRRFEIKNEAGAQTITCIITHVSGHSERTSMMAPADTSGSKNAIQSLGSTVTYLQRYTLIGALGLVTADEDNDGRTAEAPPVAKPIVKPAAQAVNQVAGKILTAKTLFAKLRAAKPDEYTMEQWADFEAKANAGKVNVDDAIAKLSKSLNEMQAKK